MFFTYNSILLKQEKHKDGLSENRHRLCRISRYLSIKIFRILFIAKNAARSFCCYPIIFL